MIRVMIVEENEFLRSGLAQSLGTEQDFEMVGGCDTAQEAVTMVTRLEPQVVLLSMTVPDTSAFEACMRILDAAPEARVIMMTQRLTSSEIIAAIMAGAASCLTKDARRTDLVRVVRANGVGEMLQIAPVAERVLRLMQHNRRAIDLDQLSGQERRVLVLTSSGLNNAAIAAELNLSPHTVRNHVRNIYAKLGVSSRAELGALSTVIGLLDVDDAIDS